MAIFNSYVSLPEGTISPWCDSSTSHSLTHPGPHSAQTRRQFDEAARPEFESFQFGGGDQRNPALNKFFERISQKFHHTWGDLGNFFPMPPGPKSSAPKNCYSPSKDSLKHLNHPMFPHFRWDDSWILKDLMVWCGVHVPHLYTVCSLLVSGFKHVLFSMG